MRNIIVYVIHAAYVLKHIDCGCDWPVVFQNSTWHDNTKGELIFGTATVTGYSFMAAGTTIDEWECLDVDAFATEGRVIMKSTHTFIHLSFTWTSYMCLQLTKVTDVSYIYYRIYGQTPDAGEERVHIATNAGLTDPAVLCNSTNAESGSAYHLIIKQGSEADAAIQCPGPILGRFDYQYTDGASGTVSCDVTAEHLNVCTDKTKLAFNQSCSQSMAYADGDVYCVASLAVGNTTYLTVYNPQDTVDKSATFRFACFAISETGLAATVVPSNCTDEQTATDLPLLHDGTIIGASIVLTPYVFCAGGCDWPTVFQNNTWNDNTRGDIVFTQTTMSGWSFTSDSSTISNWECLDASNFDSEGILILKATDTFGALGTTWISYLCLEMTAVSTDSYYYYQKHTIETSAANTRVKINNGDTLTTKAEICSTAAIVPAAEFHFLLKAGSATTAKQYCPSSLLQKMDYSYTGSDGSTACDSSVDNWDVCTDRQIMTFDYGSCPQKMAYSNIGTVWCMMTITSTYEYVVTYNTETTLSGTATRFACFAVSSDGTTASMVPNNCTENMTPTTFATSHDGTDIGATLTMSDITTCPFTSTTSSTSSGTTSSSDNTATAGSMDTLIPIIVGSIAVFLFAMFVIIAIVYFIKRKKSNVNHVDDIDKNGESAVANGHVAPMHVEDVDHTHSSSEANENPALRDSSGRITLKPLPSLTESTTTGHSVTPRANALPPIGHT